MPLKGARGDFFFPPKTRLLRLNPSFLRYYNIKQVLLYTCVQNCEKTPSKTLVFEVSKVVATGYYAALTTPYLRNSKRKQKI